MNDLISRQDAINALWKALYEYEDKTEKQFQESDELDVSEWMIHRIFVQNMSDIDRKTILELPPVTQPSYTQADINRVYQRGYNDGRENGYTQETWEAGLSDWDFL